MSFLSVIRGNRVAIPLVVSAAVAMLLISEFSYWYSYKSAQESLKVVATQKLIGDLHTRMLNAETGQRGFLLTGRSEYLQPYYDSIPTVEKNFAELRSRYKNRAECLHLLNDLKVLTDSKLAEMALTIALHKDEKTKDSMDLVLSDTGWGKMQKIREVTEALVVNEEDNFVKSQYKIGTALSLNRFGVAALTLLCLLALLLYLRQTHKLKYNQLALKKMIAQERDQLEITVLKRTHELTQLARYLQNTREDERSRLARNLHDDLGALLTSAKLDAARIKSRVSESSTDTKALFEHLVGNLNGSIALGRKIIEDLRPSALSNLGLVATLEIFAREFAETSKLQVHSEFEAVALPQDTELMIYRLMQEACTNILKYAKANSVWLRLGVIEGVVTVSVRDDGMGFDVTKQLGASYGLLGMRYRVEAADGVLNITSLPGAGTLVQAIISRRPTT